MVFLNVCDFEDVNIENILVYWFGLIFLFLFYEDGILWKICKLDLMYLFEEVVKFIFCFSDFVLKIFWMVKIRDGIIRDI